MDYQKLWKRLKKFLKGMGDAYAPANVILREMKSLEKGDDDNEQSDTHDQEE